MVTEKGAIANKKQTIIIATIKSWNIEKAKKFQKKYLNKLNVVIIDNPQEFTLETLDKIKPLYIFFPHWSWIIPSAIFNKYRCIVFHMTDVPYGRGGSPLQNLIIRGFRKTKISAISVVKELDAGSIYLKEDLLLEGSAKEIFINISEIIFQKMIPQILQGKIKLQKQKGKVVVFKRLQPENSKINNEVNLKSVYDKIRMLDAEGYPKAYLETDTLKFEFHKARMKNRKLTALVNIYEK